ncbi:drug/transporter permease [Legionella steigerwaltii]|uniref:Drug/transporter permease n=1 Tax=Legionella steigerwaltii TaxID=460 RepID=A0A378LE19_9GAMM|nr:DMT family transporter [Legionella steigerwaltii]KTD70275.1 drug/transporter permease [Legionella steigerwaltii]STY24009.1 drug/transporter permease [Legionella steigerwaltii]
MYNRLFSPTSSALGAALFFGASTPFAKQLVGQMSPLLLAGLLYAGSGIGLLFTRLAKDRGWRHSGIVKGDWIWLLGAIGFGGILGPILLMFGLQQISAASASLLLNLEAVFTALLAWFVFRESTAYRIMLGMFLIVVGGILLSWPYSNTTQENILGAVTVTGACLCWGIDNNLTRRVSAGDPFFIAGSKGLVSGTVSTSLALSLGMSFPHWLTGCYVLLIGFIGYGASLVLFVFALRGLGTARTGAYFSTAPFIGAAIAILFFHETTSVLFWIAATLMGIGIWLHLTEHHEHEHTHEPFAHSHSHIHDDHHQHKHDFPWDGKEPHIHYHRHEFMKHSHPHYPDIHHRHKHK